MGSYNCLHVSLVCPRCAQRVMATVDCHFGYTANLADLAMGDRYPWRDGKHARNGGRPPHGTVDGEGYLQCPRCGKDAFMRVFIREDVIVGVEPDVHRPGYWPD